MKVQILTEFEGYPDGDDKGPTAFNVGGDAVDVPDEFGAMIVRKGLARSVSGAAAAQVSHEAE